MGGISAALPVFYC